ncbi:MAG: hypothetical protein K2M93_05840 [Muribaculaceae bacterium]|nr:hypothetical protein [Muribaculaceae bacterium]
MKHFHYLLILLALCSMTSCGKKDNAEDVDALRIERDSLYAAANANQRDLELMTSFFDEVSACIDSVSEQERLLTIQMGAESNRRYSQSDVAMRLNQLSQIILGQRERIASLVDSLNNRVDTVRTSGLRNTIAYLTNQLSTKEAQINRLKAELSGQKRNISSLKERVNKLTSDVGDLTAQNTALSEAVQTQTEIINEGYVLVADKQQLKELGVIEGGGFLRKSKTNLSKISTSHCNKVNIAMFKELPIHAKKVKLLTPAPASSYILRQSGDMTTLVVKDATSFWSLSNILIIQIL